MRNQIDSPENVRPIDAEPPMTVEEAAAILEWNVRRLVAAGAKSKTLDITRSIALLARLRGWGRAPVVDDYDEDEEQQLREGLPPFDMAAQVRREMGLED